MDKHAQRPSATIERHVEVEAPLRDAELISSASTESGLETTLLLWRERRFLLRVAIWGLALSTIIAFLIPNRYTATLTLMPPDQQSGMGAAMLAALAGRAGGGSSMGGLPALAGDILGIKNSGDLFIGVLHSRTVQDDLVRKFDLRKVYWDRLWEDACKDLGKHSDISQDRKS